MRFVLLRRQNFIRMILLCTFLNNCIIAASQSQEWQSYWRMDTLKNFSYQYQMFGGWHEVWKCKNCTEERLPEYYCIQSNDTLLVIPTQSNWKVDTKQFSHIDSLAQYHDSIYREAGEHFLFDLDIDSDIGPGLAYISSHDTLLYCNFYNQLIDIAKFKLTDFYLHSSKFQVGPFRVGMNKETLFSILRTKPKGEVQHVVLWRVESCQHYLIATEDKQKIHLLQNFSDGHQVVMEMQADTICEISSASGWEKDASGYLWILYKKGGGSLIAREFKKFMHSNRE